ncbi:hypothetical protein QYM36_013608 [Artemia franciscana]|uniref:Homeobox domain-containing protein n=1 Tax=Artemia franciscana TaxID=6661 RepID=A0AA88HLS5_ARTSF|nr:hypothetical protein QYM36_013608 [Artemia franciscana]
MTVNPPIDMRRDFLTSNPWQSNRFFQLHVNSEPKDYSQYKSLDQGCDKKPKIGFSIESIVGNEEICEDQLTPRSSTTPQRTPSPVSSSAPTPETPVSPIVLPQQVPQQHFQWPPLHQGQPQVLEALTQLRALYSGEAQLPHHLAAAVGLQQPMNHASVGLAHIPNFQSLPGVSPMMQTSNPLYPWLMARQNRFFGHRFPPGPEMAGFLLAPFRKPKRVRTAFSPSQLLKLESAFDKNHYVVGAERKQLAQSLNLSETQVSLGLTMSF